MSEIAKRPKREDYDESAYNFWMAAHQYDVAKELWGALILHSHSDASHIRHDPECDGCIAMERVKASGWQP